jgi:xanthine dehydrogenase small subunit
VLEAGPTATLVAGATDVGLWITKFMRDISPAVFTGHLGELRRIELTDEALTLGAGASYSEAEAAMIAAFPHLAEFWPRIGGWQVRNMGTVGGNVANGSPIGDTPPVLIALGAEITLRKGPRERVLALEDFFVDYGKQDRAPGEFVLSIRIPRDRTRLNAAYKICKRRDEDISSVCGGFSLALDGGTVRDARLAFGGMAATPKRAREAEAALVGAAWSEAAARRAAAALTEDFQPITDWRASADSRARGAGNRLVRFALETSQAEGEAAGAARLVRA